MLFSHLDHQPQPKRIHNNTLIGVRCHRVSLQKTSIQQRIQQIPSTHFFAKMAASKETPSLPNLPSTIASWIQPPSTIHHPPSQLSRLCRPKAAAASNPQISALNPTLPSLSPGILFTYISNVPANRTTLLDFEEVAS